LVERLPAWSLIFQVKTFLLLTEEAMMVALMSDFNCGGTVWWAVGGWRFYWSMDGEED
jgi:uncharacterized membrane protein